MCRCVVSFVRFLPSAKTTRYPRAGIVTAGNVHCVGIDDWSVRNQPPSGMSWFCVL